MSAYQIRVTLEGRTTASSSQIAIAANAELDTQVMLCFIAHTIDKI